MDAAQKGASQEIAAFAATHCETESQLTRQNGFPLVNLLGVLRSVDDETGQNVTDRFEALRRGWDQEASR